MMLREDDATGGSRHCQRPRETGEEMMPSMKKMMEMLLTTVTVREELKLVRSRDA